MFRTMIQMDAQAVNLETYSFPVIELVDVVLWKG